jgi:hypothetical protein
MVDEPVDLAARIRAGNYDGTPSSPAELARLLVDAARDDMAGRDAIDDALRAHVAAALRSAEPRRVGIALTHVDVEARAGGPVARALIDEVYAAVDSPEWAAWAARDPDSAARMRSDVEAVADDAARRIASGICGAR